MLNRNIKKTAALGVLVASTAFSAVSVAGPVHNITLDNMGDPLWWVNTPMQGVGTLSPRTSSWAASDVRTRTDKSGSLRLHHITQDGTWLNGQRLRAVDVNLETTVAPADTQASGDLWGLIAGVSNGQNRCKFFPDLPIGGVWNGLWAGHSASIGVGTPGDINFGVSLTVGTECDGVHNGYGVNVAAGASVSSGLFDAINLATAPLPIKVTANIGAGATVKGSMGGGYTGYFNGVPHPYYFYSLRMPEYGYTQLETSAHQNFGVNVKVGIGIGVGIGGSVNTVKAKIPVRLEGGITRDNNPKNWKFYVRSNANKALNAFGGSIHASIWYSLPPLNGTLWKTTLIDWPGIKLSSITLFDKFVKGKIIVNKNTGDSTLYNVRNAY
ncbi:hypothetical protein A1OK_12080 [Enterovibrio norvegicus FF-454]|uniref:Uncharacterized protein n=1 Tax=Enterovibrio norvegicus FF-454 TaxID=1185651 RepID=A0A1E5C3Z1_9GAMM|nr:hypothetical protein [Enterovibrio norvegicus]OEE60216.1 hypothetical protein A1OK_12080 [Enterovibrio norvegicus FF-454]